LTGAKSLRPVVLRDRGSYSALALQATDDIRVRPICCMASGNGRLTTVIVNTVVSVDGHDY